MSFKPYTEKIKKKKIGICSILGRIRNETLFYCKANKGPWIVTRGRFLGVILSMY